MPTVLITGANRGLGFEFARQYAEEGWRVIGTARKPEAATALRGLGRSVVEIHALDVADFPAIAALGRQMANETIDVFIANAGILVAEDMTAERVDADAWMRSFAVNAVAPIVCAGAFVRQVARSKERKMLAISSRNGSVELNDEGGLYAYRTSKSALNAAWRSFAVDHRQVIAALLAPGWCRTDMGGPSAPIDPKDSVRGMRRVIAELGSKDSGGFFRYDGETMPW